MDIDNGELGNPVSEIVANKYLARGIIIHRGMDIIVTTQAKYLIIPNTQESIKIINKNLAGFQPQERGVDPGKFAGG